MTEVWKHLNLEFEVSTEGRVRNKKRGILHRYPNDRRYACVSMHGCDFKIHPIILRKFIPRPSPMFTMCDHKNQDRMDPRLSNLRWSNDVLNAMNRSNVRGYDIIKTQSGTKYRPRMKLLGRKHRFDYYHTEEEAKAVYEYYHRRAFATVECLCVKNIPWDIQRRIFDYLLVKPHGKPERMRWERSQK